VPVKTIKQGDVTVIIMDNPPVNALSGKTGFLGELLRIFQECDRDPSVQAIVLAGEGRFFSSGADISEFGTDPVHDVAPIRKLIESLDRIGKPIVAAMHGLAVGGGLELALACHVRLCLAGTRFAFPEVTLGLLPGAGGTQRFPRLVPVASALDLILTGRQIDADTAKHLGLVDKVVVGDLVPEAVAAARALIGRGGTLRRTRDLAIVASPDLAGAIAAARDGAARRKGTGLAVAKIVACIEAAITKTFDEGLAFEHQAFNELMVSEPASALRHVFLLNRKLGKIAGLPASRRDFASVAVIGAGTMGVGISAAMLNADLVVTLIDQDLATCETAGARIRKIMEAAVARKRMSAEQAAGRLRRLSVSDSLGDASAADLLIEAVYEDMALKGKVFREFDRVAKPDAILATNTSTLDVDRIADSVRRPDRVIGTHFFSPAHIMKLLEIVRTPRTAPDVVADTLAFARKIGKVGVLSGVCDGFIGNRMFEEYLRQAYFLLEEGALPAQIDRALEAWGFAMGPLKVMDLAGQDIGWKIRQRRAIEQPDRPYSAIPDQICEMGRFGQKTGAGYYLYPNHQNTPVPDPAIDALIVKHSAALGLDRRAIADEEIVSRCLLALVNEGARIVEDGIAARPLDVDAVYVNGYGFPDWRGGPMFQADWVGLPAVVARLRRFEKGYQGWAWTPSPLLVTLAQSGGTLGDLNDERTDGGQRSRG
jgi:3-hydroxyacyl-CoA dehydrogenase